MCSASDGGAVFFLSFLEDREACVVHSRVRIYTTLSLLWWAGMVLFRCREWKFGRRMG